HGPLGDREFGVVTHCIAVQPLLLDDLVGAGGAQLGRSIRGAHHQRHTRAIRFQHRGVKVRGSGSRGANQRDGSARSRGDAQRQESGTAFVDPNVQRQRALRGDLTQRQQQRRVPRAGTHDDVFNGVADQLVDEHRRLRGGRIHRRFHGLVSPGVRTGPILAKVTDERVSELFDATSWTEVEGFDFTDITYHRSTMQRSGKRAVRIAFDRADVRNAFRPHTVDELYRALDHARMCSDVGCVLLTGNGPSARDGGWAFCSGGDQRIRGRSGYQYAGGETSDTVEPARAGRLHILEVQRLIRFMPKPVLAVVPGWAAGGGHSLHVVCDITLASAEHAGFKQTDADVGSFDGGFGSAYLARQVGQKFAREVFFRGRSYSATEMHEMGAVNAVVPHHELEAQAL